MTHHADQVFEKILKLVFDTPAGKCLPPQIELSASLKASRVTVREAIAKLEWLGILESKPKRGCIVRPKELWKVINRDVALWRVCKGDTYEHIQGQVILDLETKPLGE